MIFSNEIVERARSLVGVQFRPQGRDPRTGLDCIGVVLWTFAIPAESVRRDYRLSGLHSGEVEAALSRWFCHVGPTQTCRGDVMLFAISQRQSHLAVNCGNSLIHADAFLRRVVEIPMTNRWPLAAAFRSPNQTRAD